MEQPQDTNDPTGAQSNLTDGLGAGYKVLLRNNETGEERFADYPFQWEEYHDYMWVDGNYGCDCNRHLFFERANGVEPNDEKCGDEKYSALYALLPNGTRHELDEAPNVKVRGRPTETLDTEK